MESGEKQLIPKEQESWYFTRSDADLPVMVGNRFFHSAIF